MLRSFGLALLFAAASCAWGQYVVSARAGTIDLALGQVSVDGRPVERKPTKFTALKNGQALRTDNGRAEILLGPGVFLRLGPDAEVRMVNASLEDTQVEMEHGTALIEVIEIADGSDVHVLVGNTRTAFRGIGLHRFDADTGELSVYGGHAEVSVGTRKFDLTRGRLVHLRGLPDEARFDPHEKDALLQWSASRSFHMFISNPAARERLSNWEASNASPAGYAVASDRSYYFNRDFGVTFISRIPGRSNSAFAREDGLQPPVTGLNPRQDPAPRPTTNQPIPIVTYPGPASGGLFPH